MLGPVERVRAASPPVFVQLKLHLVGSSIRSRAALLPDYSFRCLEERLLSNDNPMHGVHRDVVAALIAEGSATLVSVKPDDRCGPEWIGYRYFVRKNERAA